MPAAVPMPPAVPVLPAVSVTPAVPVPPPRALNNWIPPGSDMFWAPPPSPPPITIPAGAAGASDDEDEDELQDGLQAVRDLTRNELVAQRRHASKEGAVGAAGDEGEHGVYSTRSFRHAAPTEQDVEDFVIEEMEFDFDGLGGAGMDLW